MKTQNEDLVKHLEKCFANTNTMGMFPEERFLTPEDVAFGKRVRATYNAKKQNR
jgi:hypothetical protein